jgi:hypothetical protein
MVVEAELGTHSGSLTRSNPNAVAALPSRWRRTGARTASAHLRRRAVSAGLAYTLSRRARGDADLENRAVHPLAERAGTGTRPATCPTMSCAWRAPPTCGTIHQPITPPTIAAGRVRDRRVSGGVLQGVAGRALALCEHADARVLGVMGRSHEPAPASVSTVSRVARQLDGTTADSAGRRRARVGHECSQ